MSTPLHAPDPLMVFDCLLRYNALPTTLAIYALSGKIISDSAAAPRAQQFFRQRALRAGNYANDEERRRDGRHHVYGSGGNGEDVA